MSAVTRRLIEHRFAVLLFFAVLSVLAGWHVQGNLGINTDTKDLLSAELDWRRMDVQHNRLFPQYNETVLLSVEAASADDAEDAAWALYQALQTSADHPFPELYYSEALAFFRENRFLFPDLDALDALSGRLIEAQAPLGSLAADPSLRGLAKLLGKALQAGELVDMGTLPGALNASLEGFNAGQMRPLSWSALLAGEANSDTVHRRLIVSYMKPDFSGLLPAGEAIAHLREQAAALDLEGRWGARLRLGGEAILAHEELQSVARANWLAIALSLVLVTVLLCLNLGARMMLACLVTLLCGLTLTTALATITLGTLNLISVAFAVLYIGLGIDFAIHYTMAWRFGPSGREGAGELPAIAPGDHQGRLGKLAQHEAASESPVLAPRTEGLAQASDIMVRPLLLCALTTACGFFSFIPTDYRGVAELGWIAGWGMFISCALSLTLLPVLLSFTAPGLAARTGAFPGLRTPSLRHPWWVLLVAVALATLALVRLGELSFTADTLALQDPNNESVQLYKDLLDDEQNNPHSLVALTRDRHEARQLASRFRSLPEVEQVIWLEDFIPERQEEKLAVIADLQLLLGDLRQTGTLQATAPEELQALGELQAQLDQATGTDWVRLRDNLRAATEAVETGRESLDTLREGLLRGLDGRLRMLDEALSAGPVSEASLPEALKRRWYSDGYYQLMILPVETLDDTRALGDFVRAVTGVHGDVTGSALLQHEAGAAVRSAFQQAFLYALCAVTLLLALLLRSLRDSLTVLLALLLGSCLCAGGMLLMDMPFNFANIIALPLLLGIGVDSGIHILHCYRHPAGANRPTLLAVRTRAVAVSALTTVLSIGSLAFSAHLGTASLGILLALGVIIMAGCMVLVLPALLVVADSIAARVRVQDHHAAASD